MAARSAEASAVLTNEAQVNMATLAPGRYTASAIALVNNEAVGRVSRVFEIVAER